MSDVPAFRAFFGDREYSFRLTPDLVTELERITGAGIGGLSIRIMKGDFRHAELLAVIRLGLIGGGETPQTSADLVNAYAARRPIMEILPVAVGILEILMFGEAKADE